MEAQREIAQVDEMLTWMERYPLPFPCTTNAPDLLDPETARPFLFKVHSLSTDTGQIAAAFFFMAFRAEAPMLTFKLEFLTPRDFAVFAREAEALGEREPNLLAHWLADEAAAKPEGRKVRMRF